MGKKKEFFDFVKIKGKIYKVSIQPYVSPEELFKRAVNSGVFTADALKEEYGQSREETRKINKLDEKIEQFNKKTAQLIWIIFVSMITAMIVIDLSKG